MSSVILFPGQGAQFVSMGKKLTHIPIVQRMFKAASDVFKQDLLKLCVSGPQAELDRTVNCQAAVFVTSLGAIEKLKLENPQAIEKCVATAGFSVGEYAALVFSGAITFEDGLRILKKRSELMQSASEVTQSGLMSVFTEHKSELPKAMLAAREWAKRFGTPEPITCSIANYLHADCKVVGGNEEALRFLESSFGDFHIKRIKRLNVSGAFHTRLMDFNDSGRQLKEVLDSVEIKRPVISVYSNVSGKPYDNMHQIRRYLVQQITEPVKWEQIMHNMYERPKKENEKDVSEFPETFECGPGKQLGALLRLNNAKAHKLYKHVDV